jgi:hypothetical protein
MPAADGNFSIITISTAPIFTYFYGLDGADIIVKEYAPKMRSKITGSLNDTIK